MNGNNENSKIKRHLLPLLLILAVLVIGFIVPTTIDDFFFPGSQDGESGNLESPDKCLSCHGGFNIKTEPHFNWSGSMMAQAARDPLYEACLTISNQDVPFSGDVCIRCHAPEGWLGGRSIPTDGSALTLTDKEGIHCDFCHSMVRPSPVGTNPYPSDQFYTTNTYPDDQSYLGTITAIPSSPGNGSFVVDNDLAKRGPFSDPGAKHQFLYSPYHKESLLCAACHDVSNPVYSRQADGSYKANSFGQPAPSFSTYDLFPVERTYSEWLMSAYNSTSGIYAPQFGGNKSNVSTCQDCHMKDLSGVAAKQTSAVFRNDMPHHDMMGGNTIIPDLLKILFPADVNPIALDSAESRARYMLRNAATLTAQVIQEGGNHVVKVKVTNETGHKLPSGYPEGRRIWINIAAKDDAGNTVYSSGNYDSATGILTKDQDIKIYEIKPGPDNDIAALTGLPAEPSFHFVLNNKIYSDNRIPPRGFTNANFTQIQSPPVGYAYSDGQYWDETTYTLPPASRTVEVRLYYQTMSKEYVEFLRDENRTNNSGQTLYNLWAANGKSAPELMESLTLDLNVTATNIPEISEIAVYPNPTAGWTTFTFDRAVSDEFTITIIDMTGRFIVRSERLYTSGNSAMFNLEGNAPGRYVYIIGNARTKQLYRGFIIVR